MNLQFFLCNECRKKNHFISIDPLEAHTFIIVSILLFGWIFSRKILISHSGFKTTFFYMTTIPWLQRNKRNNCENSTLSEQIKHDVESVVESVYPSICFLFLGFKTIICPTYPIIIDNNLRNYGYISPKMLFFGFSSLKNKLTEKKTFLQNQNISR